MSTEVIRLDHPKLHRALQARLRMALLDPAFSLTPKKQARFRRMKLHFNEGDGCYTDFNRVVLGLNFPFFTGTINEQFHAAIVIIYHEDGHILFTDKPTWDKHVYTWMREYGSLASFPKDIMNILEDRRMERLVSLVFPRLQREFLLFGYRSVGNIEKEVNEQLKKQAPDALMKLMYIRNLLLYISYTRILPTIHHKEIYEYLKQCYPYVLYAREGDHTLDAAKATTKILDILKPLLDEYKRSGADPYTGMFKGKTAGTAEPMGGEGLEEYSDSEGLETPSEMEELMRKLVEKVREELKKEEEEKEEENDGFLSASEKGKKEEDKKEKTGDDTSSSSGEEAENNPLRDFVEDIANNLDAFEAYKDKLEDIVEETKKEAEQDPVTAALLDDLLNSTKKEVKQNFKMKREAKAMEDIDLKVDGTIHEGCEAIFKQREDMFQFTASEYEELVRPLLPIIKKTVSQIQEISQMAIENTLTHQRSGRLDRRMMVQHQAFGETKIFRNKEIETKQLQLEVMLLVDVSGSNHAQMLNEKNDTYVPRYVMNQIVSILLHEILKKLRFPHTIWTFDEGGSKKQRFSSAVDRSNCFEKQAGLFLKEVRADSNNRDGYAIRYAGEYLNRLTEQPHRLLIVLSDGQPSGSGYGGHEAIEDVRLAVEEVQKKGSKVLGIFTGHETENNYFQNMYGDNAIFCNNESIFELPKILKKVLLDEFQDIVGKVM